MDIGISTPPPPPEPRDGLILPPRHRMFGASSFCSAIDVNHLFEPNTNCVEIRKNYYLRGYTYEFIHMFAPQWNRKAVGDAMKV